MPTLISVSGDKALAIVDDDDAAMVSQFRWGLTSGGYADARVYGNLTLMHRLICDSGDKPFVDHKNGQRLDNRRVNLRPCTHAENMSNCRKRKGTSQYIGVSWQKRAEKWSAQCGGFQLGLFHNEIDAAVLRDEIALEKYGEFAKLNFPDGPPPGWVRPIRQRHRKIDDVMQMIGNWDDDTITKSMIMERLGVSSGTAKRYINHLVENDDRWKKAFTEINMGRPAILAQRIEEL